MCLQILAEMPGSHLILADGRGTLSATFGCQGIIITSLLFPAMRCGDLGKLGSVWMLKARSSPQQHPCPQFVWQVAHHSTASNHFLQKQGISSWQTFLQLMGRHFYHIMKAPEWNIMFQLTNGLVIKECLFREIHRKKKKAKKKLFQRKSLKLMFAKPCKIWLSNVRQREAMI